MPKRNKTPDWLQKIQNESWEAEILISGGALYGLIELTNYLKPLSASLMSTSDGFSSFSGLIGFFIPPLLLTTNFLSIGFLLHLIVRGLWTGMIGLSFCFPDGIKKEKLKWRGKFSTQVSKTRKNLDAVLYLERFSGIVFSFTILFFLITIGFVVWLVVLITVPVPLMQLNDWGEVLAKIIIYTYLLGSLLCLIDFASAGFFKKNRILSKIYYPIDRFYSTIMLSFLYRNIYYTFISNWGWKKFYLAILVPIVLIIFLAPITIPAFQGDSQFINYETKKVTGQTGDLKDWDLRSTMLLENNTIIYKTLKLHIKHDVAIEDSLIQYNITSGLLSDTIKAIDELDYELRMECINKFYQVEIDGNLRNVKWDLNRHRVRDKFLYYVLTSWIDVSDLKPGRHTISFKTATETGYHWDNRIEEFGYVSQVLFFIVK